MDGARNPKIQSIYLDKFPIHQAAFAAGGTHVVASSRRRHFYTFDLASASVEKVSLAPVLLPRILLSMPAAKKENYEMCLRDAVPIRDSSQSMAYFICRAPHFARPVTASLLGYSCLWMLFLLVSIGSFQLGAALLSPASPVQVAGLVGRPERGLRAAGQPALAAVRGRSQDERRGTHGRLLWRRPRAAHLRSAASPLCAQLPGSSSLFAGCVLLDHF